MVVFWNHYSLLSKLKEYVCARVKYLWQRYSVFVFAPCNTSRSCWAVHTYALRTHVLHLSIVSECLGKVNIPSPFHILSLATTSLSFPFTFVTHTPLPVTVQTTTFSVFEPLTSVSHPLRSLTFTTTTIHQPSSSTQALTSNHPTSLIAPSHFGSVSPS